MHKGLGLRHHADMRQMRYRMGDYLKETTSGVALPDDLVLQRGETLDQGETGTCVPHADAAWHNCKPRGYMHQVTDEQKILGWYDEIIKRDPWPSNDRDPDRQFGTSTQAGAQYMVELGLAEGFVWASTLEEASAFIRSGDGGVIVGSDWYMSMFEPTQENTIRVDPSSGLAGGHEWFVYGVRHLRGHRIWEAQQSWGDGFADSGTMYFWDRGMTTLLRMGMEMVAMVQTGVEPR